MRRKLTALFVMVTVFIASLSPSIQAIAESTVFHDMGGYRMRHNLDGSVTMEIYPEIEMVREGSGTEDASAAQEAEIPFQSEFTSAFTPGQALMTLTMGDGHVSFTPVMLEGLVTVTEEEEPETGDEEETEPLSSLAAEETETSTEAPEEETEETEAAAEASEASEEPTEAFTNEPIEEPTGAPTEAPPAPPTEKPEASGTTPPTVPPAPAPTASPTPTPTPTPTPEPTPEPPEESAAAPETEAKGKTFWDTLFGVRTARAEEVRFEKGFAEGTAREQSASPSKERGRTQTFRNPGRNRTITGRGSGSKEARSKQMRYDGLFDEVTDVRLTGSEDRVKEDIIIHQYLGGHVFAYQVYTEGLTLEQAGAEVHVYDTEGEHVATILAPYMYDAQGATSGEIGVSLSGGGGGYRVTYTPSDAWLGDSTRVYPVTVDPSVVYTAGIAYGYTPPSGINRTGQLAIGVDLNGRHSKGFVEFTLPTELRNLRGNVLIDKAEFTVGLDTVEAQTTLGYYSTGYSQSVTPIMRLDQ